MLGWILMIVGIVGGVISMLFPAEADGAGRGGVSAFRQTLLARQAGEPEGRTQLHRPPHFSVFR